MDNRTNCQPDDPQPPARVNTTERVADLRKELTNYGIDAYIIPTDDEHQSEFVAEADKRRAYISGFSGSAGTAVVSLDQQALWTDGRYFLEADDQLDCNWLLMKTGLPGVPSITGWLLETLPEGSRVGADPTLFTYNTWLDYVSTLQAGKIEMVVVETNLVDLVWTDKPPYVTDPAYPLELEFSGRSWEDKIADIRAAMTPDSTDMLVVTTLDETAWTLNLRGNDIPYNPVFRSYVLVGMDRVELYTLPEKITPEVEAHLHGEVAIKDYDTFFESLQELEDDPDISSIKVSSASFAVYDAVPASKRVEGSSPIMMMKAKKNEVEVQGMRNAHVKDGVALCDFLAFLEAEIEADNYWDEISAADRLEQYRSEQEYYMGLSFTTISAFGSNGAIIHYMPTPETNRQINKTSLYLVDSGAQFKDGTTDVTRTMHYGEPTAFHIEAYTRVLKGQLDFASFIFPYGGSYSKNDNSARRPLYAGGLDYRHGTSHGVGMFLNCHEDSPPNYEMGWFGSDEPGYYEDGDFGIRLENLITTVEKSTPHTFYSPAYGFDVVTLAPYEAKLIDLTMLSREQCEAVNAYHATVLDVVGTEMLNQGRQQGFDWLVLKTQPLDCSSS